MFSSSLEDSKS